MLLKQSIVDPEVLLALEPEELAPHVLAHLRKVTTNAKFHLQDIISDRLFEDPNAYPQTRRGEIERAIAEGWEWLRVNLIIVPEPGSNGQNGWMQLSRRGAALKTPTQFDTFRSAAKFPRAAMHPLIADKVWLAFSRGDLEDAVFFAFKTVEIRVREASGATANDIGISLMRNAFDKAKGPLTDLSQPEGERDSLSHLFAGAIGSYKNPYSHRTVTITDVREAQEMVILASHLLRIVDDRQEKLAKTGE